MSKKNRNKGANNSPLMEEGQHDEGADIHDADHLLDDSEDDEDDERLDDEGTDLRAGREEDSRELESRENTEDQDKLDTFRRSMFQSALPNLPELPGYHVCWLTTTNPRDPIVGRTRIGYQLITAKEVPGFEYVSVKQGDFEGYIGVNEMVAAKLPLRLYHMYMNEAHHRAPQDEEDKLKSMTNVIAEQAREASGKAPKVGDGTAGLGKGPKRGRFEEIHPIRRAPTHTGQG